MAKKRNSRTVFLAIFACLTFTYVAVDQFDVPPAELLGFLGMSVVMIATLIAIAALLAWVVSLFRGRN